MLESGKGAGCNSETVVAAQIHAMLGEVEPALDALERAFDAHVPMLAFSKVDMHLATLRGHPRFESLLKRLRLERLSRPAALSPFGAVCGVGREGAGPMPSRHGDDLSVR